MCEHGPEAAHGGGLDAEAELGQVTFEERADEAFAQAVLSASLSARRERRKPLRSHSDSSAVGPVSNRLKPCRSTN